MAPFSRYDAHFSDILQICWFACKFFATAPFRRRRICCYLLLPFEGDISAAIYRSLSKETYLLLSTAPIHLQCSVNKHGIELMNTMVSMW